jgi:hypothetical protein
MDQIKIASGMSKPGRLDGDPVGPAVGRTSERQGRMASKLWVRGKEAFGPDDGHIDVVVLMIGQRA